MMHLGHQVAPIGNEASNFHFQPCGTLNWTERLGHTHPLWLLSSPSLDVVYVMNVVYTILNQFGAEENSRKKVKQLSCRKQFCLSIKKINKKNSLLWGAWGVKTEIAHLPSGSSTSRDGQEHWFSFDSLLQVMALRPFLSHTLVTTSAGGWNLVRGWYVSNYQF